MSCLLSSFTHDIDAGTCLVGCGAHTIGITVSVLNQQHACVPGLTGDFLVVENIKAKWSPRVHDFFIKAMQDAMPCVTHSAGEAKGNFEDMHAALVGKLDASQIHMVTDFLSRTQWRQSKERLRPEMGLKGN